MFSCLLTMTTRHSRWIYMDPGAYTGHASPARSDRPLFPSRSKRQMVSIAVNLMVVVLPPTPLFYNPRIMQPQAAHTPCASVHPSQSLFRAKSPEFYQVHRADAKSFRLLYAFISLFRFFSQCSFFFILSFQQIESNCAARYMSFCQFRSPDRLKELTSIIELKVIPFSR